MEMCRSNSLSGRDIRAYQPGVWSVTVANIRMIATQFLNRHSAIGGTRSPLCLKSTSATAQVMAASSANSWSKLILGHGGGLYPPREASETRVGDRNRWVSWGRSAEGGFARVPPA